MQIPKFEIGETVYKHTGNYGGPGIVRGIANDKGQPLRYLVGHGIMGGYGEFYHVYAEGNLREVDPNAGDLPPRMLPPQRTATGNELLDALVEAHVQVDMLMAMVIGLDKSFMPSKSALWPEIVKRVELIRKHEGTP
ncbi:hypothetical protein KIP88_03020 [Bradyrhizobium sp. SRL28]|uniref:hypothetical protein n=1 Tax=Bradyrhizobium sp. SRL28 TaxID=2836178 RepID=UPI001BDDE82C|nr:hypothetical protein [Bradyrhizobium sp. SRL28]MBT1509464.1 hypothetical protein [Bradyrhizobium sp. SRL28]